MAELYPFANNTNFLLHDTAENQAVVMDALVFGNDASAHHSFGIRAYGAPTYQRPPAPHEKSHEWKHTFQQPESQPGEIGAKFPEVEIAPPLTKDAHLQAAARIVGEAALSTMKNPAAPIAIVRSLMTAGVPFKSVKISFGAYQTDQAQA